MNIQFFKIIPKNADHQFLLSYIIQEAHPVIARYGDNQIGTILPAWQLGAPGESIAFCGNKTVLDKIRKQKYFCDLVDQGVLKSTMNEVSTDNCKTVRFIKNQKITGSTPKAAQRKVRRIIRRQIERGEIQHAREYRPRADQQQKGMPDTFFHLFYPDSISTQRNMPLCIQLIPVGADEPAGHQTFDHYGFSTLNEHRATVPLISPFF